MCLASSPFPAEVWPVRITRHHIAMSLHWGFPKLPPFLQVTSERAKVRESLQNSYLFLFVAFNFHASLYLSVLHRLLVHQLLWAKGVLGKSYLFLYPQQCPQLMIRTPKSASESVGEAPRLHLPRSSFGINAPHVTHCKVG